MGNLHGHARLVALLAATALLLAACGDESEPTVAAGGGATTSTSTSTATTAPPQPNASGLEPLPVTPPEDGPATLVLHDADQIRVVDLRTGDQRVLVEASDGSAIRSIDLSPDGTTVVFSLHEAPDDPQSRATLHRVPTDGSAPPEPLDVGGSSPTWADHPLFSPDGRWLAATLDGELVVLPASGGDPVGPGRAMPYPPLGPTWAPDGAEITWTDHFGRGTCCPLQTISVDPATGRFTGEPVARQASSPPWYDATGALHASGVAYPTVRAIDVDAQQRYVLGVRTSDDGISSELVWWPGTEAEPTPQPLGITIDTGTGPSDARW